MTFPTDPRASTGDATAILDKPYAAFLFDMDGTLLTSVLAAERIWGRWAARHGVDQAALMAALHGVRAIDTVRRFAPAGIDADAEAALVDRAEIEDVEGVAPIAGVLDFLASLPANRWAIVTSATVPLMRARMGAAGVPLPHIAVTAEDVERGKPAPDGYSLAAGRLGFDPAQCLVFEDAAAGIAAGEAAGADVAVISATHATAMATQHARLHDYAGLRVRQDMDGMLRLTAAK
jgi:mannitol-1-/sugar-/sorbitol-6-phosphatase